MTQVLFDRLKSNLAQCINDGTIYFVKDSNGNFTQIALGDGSKSHVVGIGPKMDDTTKQDLMSKLGLTISSNMGTIQLGKLANQNGVSSQKVVTYERTGLGTDTHEISTVGYVQQYMKTAKAMVYAGIFNAQTKEITDYNNAIISPSEEGNVTFDYLLNGTEGESLLTPGMSFIVGTAGNLEGYTGISVYGGETNVEVGDMIIIINVQQKESEEGGSTYNEASILIMHNTSLNISDGAITTAKLADGAVTASKLSTDIQSLISNLSKTATFAGIATPTTNPGTPEGHVFYIAKGKGTYTNFGGIDVTEDEVVILYYDTIWHKDATGIASNDKLTELERVVGITPIEVPEFVVGMESTDGHSVNYFEASNRCRFADGMYMESHQGDIFRTDWSNYGMYVIEGVIVDGVWLYESQGWKSADYVAKFESGRVYCAFRHNDQRDISEEDIDIIKGAFSFIPLVPSKNNIEKLDERVTALEQASTSPSGEYVPFADKLICGIGDSIMIGVASDGESIVDGKGEMGMQFNSSGGFLGSIKRKYPSVTTLNMGIGGTTIAQNAQVPSNVYGCIVDRINNIPDSVDYIILEGGINDYFHLDKIPFGADDLLKDYTPYFAEWDSSTEKYKNLTMGIKYGGGGEDNIFAFDNFIGALHISLAKIMTRFYDKKYMYVIPHNTNNDHVEDKYFDAIVSVCKKMQFPCLDLRLYSGMSRIAQLAGVDSTSREHKFTIDAVHPNQLGYDLRYMPVIVDFLKKL